LAHQKLVFLKFIRYFLKYSLSVIHVLIMLLILLILGAVLISRVEGMNLANSIYFSFITGFTIGYGDISPNTITGKVISVLIGLIGITYTGLVVAISVRALSKALEHENKE